jgi:SAM-dependent methyltransferase
MGNLVEREFWEGVYAEPTALRIVGKSNHLRVWLEHHVPPVDAETRRSCLEIGCYPGNWLAVFGELGYELSGLDWCRQLETLPPALEQRGYRVGEFWNTNFLGFRCDRQFDYVVSFGFIEHFTDWASVLAKHLPLVKPGGSLIVTCPNFLGGFQHWLHRTFDRANYDRHYIPSMDVEQWVPVVERSGFRVRYRGYFGPFDYWIEAEDRPVAQRLFLRALKTVRKPVRTLLPRDRKAWSPWAGLVAQKN